MRFSYAIQLIQSFHSKVLRTILSTPWHVTNYTTQVNQIQVFQNPFLSTVFILPNPFLLSAILLIHHIDLAGSGLLRIVLCVA